MLFFIHYWNASCMCLQIVWPISYSDELSFMFDYPKLTFTLVVCAMICLVAWLCFTGWIEPEDLRVYTAIGSTEIYTTRILSRERYWICFVSIGYALLAQTLAFVPDPPCVKLRTLCVLILHLQWSSWQNRFAINFCI